MIEGTSGKGSGTGVRRQNEGGKEKISPTSEQATQLRQTARKKKSPLCFIYSALYPWQPERSGKLGPRFTRLGGLGFHRGSQMWGRWARAARCSPTQPSCLFGGVWALPSRRGGAAERVMGILWERRFVAIEPGGRGRARRGEMRVSTRMQRLCRLGARCRTTADWSSHRHGRTSFQFAWKYEHLTFRNFG